MAVGGRDDDHLCTGTLTVLAPSGDQAPERAVGKATGAKNAAAKKATTRGAGKKGAGKKGAGKKGAGKEGAGAKRSSR